MQWTSLELRPLFDTLISNAAEWEPEIVLERTEQLGKLVIPQLSQYEEGKYRRDRNEAIGFFEAIGKFITTGLPISLDHFESLVRDYKNRISPYPHYSGIVVHVPQDFEDIDTAKPENVPELADVTDHQNDNQMKLL